MNAPDTGSPQGAPAEDILRLFRDWQDAVARQTGHRPSQGDLAARVGATQGAISQFLHGRTRIGAEMALRLAAVFQVHPRLLRPDLPFPEGGALAPSGPAAAPSFVTFFRSASPYIHAHRGKTFVIHLPGEAVDGPGFPSLIHDVSLLHTLGVRVVIVFGIRPQLSERLSRAGIDTPFVGGYRVTPPEAVPALLEASGSVRTRIEALFTTSLPTSLMAGFRVRVASGNFLTSHPIGVREGVDYHHTGTVRGVDTEAITALLDQGAIVMVSPVGYAFTGEIFNLSSLDVAAAVAARLSADKLLLLTGRAPLVSDGNAVGELSIDEARRLLPALDDPEPVATLLAALDGGVRRGHLIDRALDGGLLTELYTRDGCGTMISARRYESLRAATPDDIPGILALIAPLEEAGVLVRRSREQLEREIGSFLVTERDGTLIACAALHEFPAEQVAELACLAVHPDYRKSGRATELLAQIERIAIERALTHLFVLTTQTAHWFLEHGFEAAAPSDLPVARQALYNYRRGSRVYRKPLRRSRA